ncbi:ABC-2 family transporter protein [Verrucomicrobium sp. GAS474]|uniref:ABC transporter permease n=1 Tax=Verrucomicrobium sp. GAS474 TaxID=1882831 RepID=UPI0012FF7E51|nr:ABC-2 family transporter protein [Verrucomicrobium sp. GAS474]
MPETLAPSLAVPPLRGLLRGWRGIFALGFQSALIYRWGFFLRVFSSLLPLIVTWFVWGAVYQGKGTLGGYSWASMMAYYFALLILDNGFAPTEDDFQIAADIRDGKISQILLRPLNYGAYRFLLFVSSRAAHLLFAALPLAAILWYFREVFVDVPLHRTLLPALVAFCGSAVLQFAVSFMTGLLAFWLLEVGGIVFILFSLEFLVGGHIFPIDLLPEPWRTLAICSPFASQYWFPVSVLLGHVEGAALWKGFALQAFWIGAALTLAAFIWKRGLKRYTAVGG